MNTNKKEDGGNEEYKELAERLDMTEEQVKENFEKRKAEIGKLHPTVEKLLELLCASGRACANALSEAVCDKEAFSKMLQEDDSAETIKHIIGFLQTTIRYAEPFINKERGVSSMLAIMFRAKLRSEMQNTTSDNDGSKA